MKGKTTLLKKGMSVTPFKYSRQFWLMCISTYLFFFSFNFIISELPGYLELLGGANYKGLIIGLFTVAAFISRPFSGNLADTIGRVPVIVIGTVVCILLGALYPLLTTVFGFLILRFFHGFSTGFQPTGTTAYIADIVPMNRRGEAMGYLGVAGTLGMSSGPYFGSMVVKLFSYDVMFLTSSVAAILSLLILVGLKETIPEKKPFTWEILKIWKYPLYDPKVKNATITMFLNTFCFGMVLTVIPDYSEYIGMENSGIFLLVFTAASLLTRLFAGKLSDVKGRIFVLMISSSMIGIAMVLLGFNQSVEMYYTCAVLFGLGTGMNSPTIFAWTVDLGDELKRARSVATVFMALEAGIFSGAVFPFFIYWNNPENFSLTFWFGSLFSITAFFYLVYLTIQQRKNAIR
ncbi:MAG: MFS transporter [Cyclobacteriaceae bacterium]|nr:MFS transporter [Cyclobacteriaceae bacterium]